MMAVRLPTSGIPGAGASPYMTAGMPGMQGLQGIPMTLGQPQVLTASHYAASPSHQALAALQSPTSSAQSSSITTSAAPPTIMSVAGSLPQHLAGASAGIPASYLAQYGVHGIPGMAGIPGMSLAGGAAMGLVSTGSPISAGQLAVAQAQYPGLAEWSHPHAGAQMVTQGGATAVQLATGISPSAYSQQVANLASAQIAGLQAQHIASGGIPAAHLAQYGSQFQAAGLSGLQLAGLQPGLQQAIPTQATPPPASTTPDNKKKIQQEIAAQAMQGLQMAGYGAYAVEAVQQAQYQDQDASGEDSVVMLDDYNSDLNLVIDENGYEAQPLVDPPGFCFCWSGVRCTHGVSRGKAYYECKMIENLPVDFGEDHQETDPHIIRVGWSMDLTSFQLGEEPNSYGYGGTGKFSTNSKFVNYGEKFDVGDVIGCLLDLDSRPPNMSYAKNGRWLGVAQPLHGFQVGKKENALFPHILTKNMRFEVNFGQQAPWFPPAPGFMYIMQYPVNERVRGLKPPSSKQSCEMIMIIGLPGSGKTTWGINKAKQNPEMRYNIIGTDTLIDKMKVMGLPRKNNYHGRWDVLIDKASKCLNKLFEIASKKKRNLILDQTNVYPSARRRKMRNFKGFIRRAAILVPDDQELKRRSDKRTYEDGKYVPEEAVLDMKANFKLPAENDDNFDYIEYVELPREKAMPLVDQYNLEGQTKRPQAVKGGGFRANQNDNRFKPPADLKQPPLPPGTYGSQGGQNSSQRGSQPPPPPPPDHYGAQRHRERDRNEPPEKRGRYDQSAGGSALDFIKQEYSGEVDSAQDQDRKSEAWQGFGGEHFAGGQHQVATTVQLQEQFAGRGLIAVGAQHFLGQLQPGQGLLGEYGSQQNEQLAAIAYGAQTAFVGGFNPPVVATIKQEPGTQPQLAWQARGPVPQQSVQINQPRVQNPNPAPDQNRTQGQVGGRPGSGFGGQRNPTPPTSRPNQFGSGQQNTFQQRNNSSPGIGNKNPKFQGEGNQGQNRFGVSQNQFSKDQNHDQDQQNAEDDKQTKRERRRPSKWDNPEENKEDDNSASDSGHQDFQNALSNLRNKIAEQEAANNSNNQNQNDHKPQGGQGFNPGGQPGGPPKGGSGMMGPGPIGPGPGGPGGPGPGAPGSQGPRGPPPRGMNPRGPPPGNFNGPPPPFGQPGPPRGPRGPGIDGPPPFARGRGGFSERGPPGNRGPPPMRPGFGPRGEGDGPGPRGPRPGWNPRPGGPPGGPRGYNPRMGGPGPRGPFPPGPPGRFNRPPPPMGQQRWQRPPPQ